mgnify:FL=1
MIITDLITKELSFALFREDNLDSAWMLGDLQNFTFLELTQGISFAITPYGTGVIKKLESLGKAGEHQYTRDQSRGAQDF